MITLPSCSRVDGKALHIRTIRMENRQTSLTSYLYAALGSWDADVHVGAPPCSLETGRA